MQNIEIQLIVIIAISYVLFLAINTQFGISEWIALIGIGAIFAVSVIDRQVDSNHRKRIACYSIIREIDDTEFAYTSNDYPHVVREGDGVDYVNAFLNTDIYQSLISTGEIMEFKTEVQNDLSNFYINIMYRNEALKDFNRHNAMFFINGVTQDRLDRWTTERVRYEVPLTQYENYIRQNLDDVRTEIRNELP